VTPSSSRATRFTASTSGSPNRTVPPGRCQRPLQGPKSRSAIKTPLLLEAITSSTVRRGTLLKIRSNSSFGRGPFISPGRVRSVGPLRARRASHLLPAPRGELIFESSAAGASSGEQRRPVRRARIAGQLPLGWSRPMGDLSRDESSYSRSKQHLSAPQVPTPTLSDQPAGTFCAWTIAVVILLTLPDGLQS
jgi:hypothetical protein